MSLRLFIALPIGAEAAAAARRLQQGVPDARWSPQDNFHITLRFLGDTLPRDAEALDDELGRIFHAPFDLELAGAGHFGGERPHALWLGVAANPALKALQAACEAACRRAGFAEDARAWTPHMTVAWLGRATSLDRVMAFETRLGLFRSPPWTADRFHLVSSHVVPGRPSAYRIEAEYPLQAPGAAPASPGARA